MPITPKIIRLEGEWDYYRSVELRSLFEKHDGADSLVIDLSATRYIDSTLLTELVRLRQRRTKAALQDERLVVASPDLARIFEITRLNTLWKIFPTLDAATASFNDKGSGT